MSSPTQWSSVAPAAAPGGPRATGVRGRTAMVLIAVLVAVLALAATTTVAVVQSNRTRDLRAQLVALEQQLAEARAEAEEARAAAAAAAAAGEQGSEPGGEAAPAPAPTDPFEDLFGGGAGGLEELLEQLEELLGGAFGGEVPPPGSELPGVLGEILGDRADVQTALLPCVGDASDVADVDPDQELEALVAEISGQVEELRGLDFPAPVTATLLTPEELSARVEQLVTEEYPTDVAAVDARLLTAVGAIAPGTDLVAAQRELLAGQVAGFYDPETGELVVGADAGSLSATELIALAHELEHALADAAIGLPIAEDAAVDDGALAALAVVEGDAVLLQSQYQQVAISPDLLLEELLGGDILAGSEGLAAAPPYLAASLLFPYTEGAAYVCSVYQDGGWAGVNAALAAPPATTLEVLDPAQAGFVPVDVVDPALAAPWTALDTRTFGAADLQWLLEAPGGDRAAGFDGARDRALAWRGGEAHTFGDGDRTAVGLALAGDSGLCPTLAEYYAAAFPDAAAADPGPGETAAWEGAAQSAVLRCSGDDVRLGIGPDLATATAVAR